MSFLEASAFLECNKKRSKH